MLDAQKRRPQLHGGLTGYLGLGGHPSNLFGRGVPQG
jgi:hypothetical protein